MTAPRADDREAGIAALTDPSCRHSVIRTYSAADPAIPPLWACESCNRRFYPACPECVSVGHRGDPDLAHKVRDAIPAFQHEFTWLVERGQSMGQVPTVWLTEADGWTTDACRARRFATREACEAFIDSRSGYPIPSHGGPEGSRFGIAVEHGWVRDAIPAEPDRAAPEAGSRPDHVCCVFLPEGAHRLGRAIPAEPLDVEP